MNEEKREGTKKSLKRIAKKYGSITLDILEYISLNAEMFITAFYPKEARRLLKYGDFETYKIFAHLRRLGKSKLITLTKENGKYSVKITNKGKIKLLENSDNKVCDGKLRMISYDIPEPWKGKRIRLARSLRRIGFQQLQKSLWVTPYIKADEVELIINDLGLNDYVVYMIVEKTDSDEYLRNLFSANP